jgi:hypothetical protein
VKSFFLAVGLLAAAHWFLLTQNVFAYEIDAASAAYAQPNRTYHKFAEVKVVPNERLSMAEIAALPKAPGSKMEALDGGTAFRVQIPAEKAEKLVERGAKVEPVRNFLLVEPAGTVSESGQATMAAASSGYEYGQADAIVDIPTNGDWDYSVIDFFGFPAASITSVDVHWEIEAEETVFVYADLTDENLTYTYSLILGDYGSNTGTKYGISGFNGKPLNQMWVLWASQDTYWGFGTGHINYWWIKLYYNSNSASPYCSAGTWYPYDGYEFISRVAVGSIDNESQSSGYANYTGLSTSMSAGQGYPIIVINGNAFDTDECGIWVDWNMDSDFDDVGEMIVVRSGVGPYTAVITPPAGVQGSTRMRVRIVDSSYDTLEPCGAAGFGEVEDYTINVTAPAPLKVSGHISGSMLIPDDTGVGGIGVEVYYSPSTPSGLTDVTDASGYYEIEVPSPWTGYVKPKKKGYVFTEPFIFENVTSDQVQNFQAYILGDFAEPWGIDLFDLGVFSEQWMLARLSSDVAPNGGDGIVNFADWAVFASDWQGDMLELADFVSQWLELSAYCGDIAPEPDGDGVVNFADFAMLAENWL